MNTTRFDFIMSQVNAWAKENAGWDCSSEVKDDVMDMLTNEVYSNWTDEAIVEEAIASWMMYE